ncbi:MAG: hypothetical protein GY941_16125, partial [Planctomycetes bacterium]|nr:hypothetical protein [Planctomycetota bacterium]
STSIFENYVGTVPDESQVLYETSDNTVVHANGEVDTDSTTDITMQFWNKSTGEMEQLVLLIESGFQAAWAKNSNIILGIH